METNPFQALSPCTLADCLTRDRVMDSGIRPLWPEMPRVAGPAFTVRCSPGDNLMLHAAIYRAKPGSIIVVEAGDADFAVAGGNVCAIAKKLGIAGFVVDGVIRDLAEVRANRFPVFARGVIPKPGTKERLGTLNHPVSCGGITVESGDMVIADEEGIVVVPHLQLETVLKNAQTRAATDASLTLEQWQSDHHAKVEAALKKVGFSESHI